MPVLVSVLGGVAVEHDGRRLDAAAFGARRPRLVLAALATSSGRLTAEQLAQRVWDDPPTTWPAALRGTVAALRQTLEAIDLGGQRLIRTAPGGWILADDAAADLDTAEALAASGDPASAEDAARLLAEEVLPGDTASWIDALRERRAALHRRALHAAGEAALREGRSAVAMQHAEQLVGVDPLDEPAFRLLMRALTAGGDRAGAIRAFDRCRQALTDELGVDPDPETVALYLDVLQSGPAPRGALPPRPTNRFIGRADELDAVLAALSERRPVTVVGLGGMGKSRLALEALHDSRLDAAGGRFWAGLGDLPDAALVPAAVATAVGADSAADPVAAIVGALAPLGRTVLVLDGGERYRDAVAELAGVLLAGVPSLGLLCTSRVPLGVDRETRLDLGPLDADGAASGLLRARMAERGGASRLDARAATELATRLGGAPLAIELAAAQLATVSAADLVDGIAEAADGAAGVFETLAEQSWGAFDDAERRLLVAIGVVDGTVPLPLVRALVEGSVPPQRAARLLGGLAEAGFAAVDRASTRWRYGVDPHLRPFVRARTPAGVQADGIRALASALDEVAPANASAPPGPHRDAIGAAMDAFRAVFAAAADGRIASDRALPLAFRLHRHWASTGLAEGRYWLGRLLAAAPASEAADLAGFAAGYLAYWAGDVPEALKLLPAAGDALAAGHPEYAARAWLYAAGLSDDVDEPDRALDEVSLAVALARRVPGTFVLSVELGVASVLAERGDPAAVDAIDRAFALLPDDAPEMQRRFMAANAALAAWRSGDAAAARRFAAQADGLRTGEPGIARSQLTTALAALALQDGDATRAVQLAAVAVGDLTAVGATHEMPTAASVASRAALVAGDPAAAAEYARAGMDAAVELGTAAAAAPALEAVISLFPDGARAGVLAATAQAIRGRGRRPTPPGLEVGVPAAGVPLAADEALRIAYGMLVEAV